MAIGPICRVLLAALAVLSPLTADAAFGFGRVTTGGGNAGVVRPSSLDNLRQLLCGSRGSNGICNDNTARVIELDRFWDFRRSMGTTSGWGCYTNNCGVNTAEFGIASLGYCNGRTAAWVTYDRAGNNGAIMVGSNKSLRGVGNRGGIVGAGLRVLGQHNIIIRNIALTDINGGIVWGGDGITLDGVDRAWIDHNYFARIGRQMIVTGFGRATQVTISDNVFDGRSQRSAYCNGNHYWNLLFAGRDQMTFAGNLLTNMSGRAPQVGTGHYHIINNYFRDHTNLGGIGCTENDGHLLIEGNYFQRVLQPIAGNTGRIYAPFWNSWRCDGVIGRWCVANDQVGSGNRFRPENTAGIEAFRMFRSFMHVPFPANRVIAFVNANAGTGKV